MCWGAFVYHDIHSRPRRCCHHWWTSLLRVRGTSSSCFCLLVVTLIIQRVCMMNSSCILQETGDISGIKRSSSHIFYYIMSRKCLIKLEIAAEYVRRNPPSSLLFRPEERHFHLSRWCHKWAVHEGSELLCGIIRHDTQLTAVAAVALCFGAIHSSGSEASTKLLIIDVHRLVINNESLQSVFCCGSFSIHDVYRRLTEWVQRSTDARESFPSSRGWNFPP